MTISELHRNYNTQEKCIARLEKLRWGNKPKCVHCKSDKVYKRKGTIKWHCNNCNTDNTVLYDTIFEETRLPLPQWFEIINFMNNAKMGVSAAEIARNTGVTYKTAWYCGMRTRCAMIDNEIRLEGLVEFDESYFGGKARKQDKKSPENEPNLADVVTKRGRGTNKVPVVGAVEKKGQVYVKIIEKLTGKNLLTMLKKTVKTDESIVFTDEFKSYGSFDKVVDRVKIKHSESYGSGLKTINTIEGFWSLLKNGIRGNYRAISKKYLPFYLAEFSYKFNNRHLKSNSFEKLLENAVKEDTLFVNYKPIKKDTKALVYSK
jgi:transposase-like protein